MIEDFKGFDRIFSWPRPYLQHFGTHDQREVALNCWHRHGEPHLGRALLRAHQVLEELDTPAVPYPPVPANFTGQGSALVADDDSGDVAAVGAGTGWQDRLQQRVACTGRRADSTERVRWVLQRLVPAVGIHITQIAAVVPLSALHRAA